jgi:hypothetical protein
MSAKTSVGWMVKDLIPEEGLVIAFGDSGAGKSPYMQAHHVCQCKTQVRLCMNVDLAQ